MRRLDARLVEQRLVSKIVQPWRAGAVTCELEGDHPMQLRRLGDVIGGDIKRFRDRFAVPSYRPRPILAEQAALVPQLPWVIGSTPHTMASCAADRRSGAAIE